MGEDNEGATKNIQAEMGQVGGGGLGRNGHIRDALKVVPEALAGRLGGCEV